MPIGYNGNTYPLVSQDKMTPGEIDAVERVTGLTLQKIRRMGATCVCDHDVSTHLHKDDDGEQTDDTSCTECSCVQHSGDVPTRVTTAFMWVSVKRGEPTLKYGDFADAPLSDWNITAEPEDEGTDPTEPPLAAE
jgi:hypothetical protein